jgi:hypothetical protein
LEEEGNEEEEYQNSKENFRTKMFGWDLKGFEGSWGGYQQKKEEEDKEG